MKAKFSHASLTINEIYRMYKKNELRIPSYQRSIKWNDEKRQALISTIKEGNPMGAILVYKDAEGFRIIDGLQRISTIIDYNSKLYKYISEESISEDNLDLFYEMYRKNSENKISRDKLATKFIKIIRSIKEEDDGIKGTRFNRLILDSFDFVNKDIYLDASEVVEEICESLFNSEISEYPIFMIKYEGSDDELPDIFHALNTGAVNLTKYEVIASTWNEKSVTINNEKILRAMKTEIKSKYDKMETDGFTFEFEGKVDLEQSGSVVNLFEMCEALGKILGARTDDNILFSQKQSSELGFEIISLLLHGKKFTNDACEEKIFEYSKPSNIVYFLNNETDENEVSNLLEAIFDVKDTINHMLKQFIYYRKGQNSLMQKYMAKHIFKSLFEKKYSVEYINGKLSVTNNNLDLSQYKNNVIAAILNDEVTNFWTKNRQLSDFIRMIERNTDKYDSLVPKDKFIKSFENYLSQVMEEDKGTYDRSTFNNTTKILSYAFHRELYASEIEYQSYFEGVDINELEFDHNYPKSKLLGSNTYVSSILNCWVYTKKSNRSKGAKNTNAVNNENYVSNVKFDEMIGRKPIEDGFDNYSKKDQVELFEKNSEDYKFSLIRHMDNLHNLLSR